MRKIKVNFISVFKLRGGIGNVKPFQTCNLKYLNVARPYA